MSDSGRPRCYGCALYMGDAGKGFSRCGGHELENGFAVVWRQHIRPESVHSRPCRAFVPKKEGR